ncbi:MAG: HAD-IA family hydrolase [Ruminococcus sp.]|nr:HAD-IA family hydrolase [Ruminococcus sp.]
MKYSVCIFDFDLTLADSIAPILDCFKFALNAHGVKVPSDDVIVKTIGLTLEDAFEEFLGEKNDEMILKLSDTYRKRADEVMTPLTRFYDDTLGVLQLLKNAGVKIGIVSTKRAYRIREVFERENNLSVVDKITGIDEVSACKPDPEGLEKTVLYFGAPKENVLYIGDSYIDALTAKRAGIDFCAVLTGTTTKEEFLNYPNVAICSNLTQMLKQVF